MPSELCHGQSIDAVIFGMRADELHEGDLPLEIEGSHQAIIASSNFEPNN